MALCSPGRDEELFTDMREMFPELSDTVVESYVRLFPRNREECVSQLTRASHEQLYSRHDSEEASREFRPSLLEPLPPPFVASEADLPPPYPGELVAATDAPAAPLHHRQAYTTPYDEQRHHTSTVHLELMRGNAQQKSPSPIPQYQSQVSISISPGAGSLSSSRTRSQDSQSTASREEDMTQALLMHQRQRYDLLQRTYLQQLQYLQLLRDEVETKEMALMRKNLPGISHDEMEELSGLRRENRKLDVECHCLLSEVDLYDRGEIPLGATDENFYSRINPGQSVPVASAIRASPPGNMHMATSTWPGGGLLSEDEENQDGNRWKCSKCTFLNHPALDKCEVCELPNNVAVLDRDRRAIEGGGAEGPWIAAGHQNFQPFDSFRIRLTHSAEQGDAVELCVQRRAS